VDEFGEKILEELDYRQEARNIQVGGGRLLTSREHGCNMEGCGPSGRGAQMWVHKWCRTDKKAA
jgi:hypothetical protein